MNLFKSLKSKNGLGLLMGAKLRPRLRSEVLAVERLCEDKLKIFTIS